MIIILIYELIIIITHSNFLFNSSKYAFWSNNCDNWFDLNSSDLIYKRDMRRHDLNQLVLISTNTSVLFSMSGGFSK